MAHLIIAFTVWLFFYNNQPKNNVYYFIKTYNIKEFYIKNGIMIKSFNMHIKEVLGIKSLKDKNNKQYFVSYSSDKNLYLWSFN